MRRLTLSAFMLLVALCAPCAAGPPDDDAITEVPFTLEKGHVIVKATIKDDKPVEVVLSTGSEHSYVNSMLLEKYKLQLFYTGVGIITGSSTDRTVTFTNVPDVRVGGTKASSLSMLFGAQSVATINERVGREIFAVLGADFFKGRVVQFDFQKQVVRFLPRLPDALKSAGPGRAVMRFRYNADALALPVVEDVTFNGKKVKTLFDTGALTVVSLTASGAKQVGLEALAGKGATAGGTVGSVRLGDIEFKDVPARPASKLVNLNGESFGVEAVVGVGLLRNVVSTFDFPGKLVIIERQ
jgi:hypothetical protein